MIVDNMIQAGKKLGFKLNDPGFIVLKSRNARDWISEIEKDIQKNGKPEIIVTLTFDKDALYG